MARVLIVDDEADNRYYLRVLLEGSGYAVVEAANGVEALEAASRKEPALVISDLLMPEMDGYSLLWRWRADPKVRHIPFIVYTATYTEPEDEHLALGLGADAFVVKPAEPEALLARINEVWDRNRDIGEGRDLPFENDPALLRRYADVLFHKLEKKTAGLLEANRALQRDLQERSRIEVELRANEKLLRLACRIARMGGWTIELPDRTVIWSEEVRSIHEVDADFEPALEVAHSAYPSEARAGLQAAVDTCIAEGVPFDLELPMTTARGRQIWVRAIGEAVESPEGTILRIQGALQDITDRKGDELALLASEERFQLLGKATNDAIRDLDIETGSLWWNEGFEGMFGYRPQDVEPSLVSWTSRIHPDDEGSVIEGFRQAIESSVPAWSTEYRFVRNDGTYAHVLDRCHIIRDSEGAAVRVVCGMTDLSERKKLEAQFLRTQRMESIGTLAGGIAHDLNNVLLPILMSVDLLKLDNRDADTLELIESIETSAQRGADMVRQVLAFARGVEGRRVPVDVGRLVRDFGKILRDTFPKNVELVFEVPRTARTVEADPTQIQQVLMNLCVNSRDAMPSGGRLTVSVGEALVDESAAESGPPPPPGRYLTLAVQDTGTGMSAEVRDRIWEPFFTTKDIGHGTGLGLPTALSIVQSHGGFIAVDTRPAEGTCFTIHLPIEVHQERAEGPPPPPPALVRGNGEIILVVDDEPGVREVARTILERFGYQVRLAANGVEAVSAFATDSALISAVLLDMAMPVMDGPATIPELCAIDPHVRIIGSSGYSAADGNVSSLGPNVIEFIPKPYSAELLLGTVARVVARVN